MAKKKTLTVPFDEIIECYRANLKKQWNIQDMDNIETRWLVETENEERRTVLEQAPLSLVEKTVYIEFKK